MILNWRFDYYTTNAFCNIKCNFSLELFLAFAKYMKPFKVNSSDQLFRIYLTWFVLRNYRWHFRELNFLCHKIDRSTFCYAITILHSGYSNIYHCLHRETQLIGLHECDEQETKTELSSARKAHSIAISKL